MYSYKSTSDSGILLDADARRVKVVVANFNSIDLDNDIIIPEAVTKTIKERGPKGSKQVWALIDHCSNLKNALGKPDELYVEGNNLIAITPVIDTEIGEDMLKLYKAGCITEHSIGFSTIKSDWQDQKQNVRVIKELKLYEYSAVLWGANPKTPTIGIMKSEFKPSVEDINKRLDVILHSFKHGSFTDETFSLMEIEIEQLKSLLATQPAKAVEPDYTKEIVEQLTLINLKLI